MYTYIIIDDERLIRLGLISKVNEIKSEEFKCIGEAANGIEGLALIEEKSPDIVLTDMKMAKMDGVEFLKTLQESRPGIPVIVISGYKAFDYMNQAIEHGVVGYILKPFSVEELEKQLLKAVTRLEQQKSITQMQEKVNNFEKHSEGMNILKLILEPWSVDSEWNGSYKLDNWHILVNIYTNIPDGLHFLRNVAIRFFGKDGYLCLQNPALNGQFFWLFHEETEEKIKKIEERLSDCIRWIERQNQEKKLFLSVGNIFHGLSFVNRSYEKNEQILRNIYLTDHTRAYFEKEYTKIQKKLFTDDEIQDLMVILKYESDGCKKAMKRFFSRFDIQRDSLLDIGNSCKKLLSWVDEWAVENQVDTDDIMAVFYHRYHFLEDIDKMEKEISGYVNLIALSIQRKTYDNEYVYEKIIQFIHENYYKKITLQTLANKFYISAAQCSNILKERMDMGLNQYLTDIRIEKAKELLDKTTMSAEQISKEIGYPNPKYFFRMFKQATTFTPIEYRNRRK